MQFGPLTEHTVGRLRWANLQVGVEGEGPGTDSPVWLAPRRVPAAMVRTPKGETERFLFYRGVGRVASPLRVSRDASGENLLLTAQFPALADGAESQAVVPRMWLVDIRDDGTSAFRVLSGFSAAYGDDERVVGTTASQFDDADFAPEHIAELAGSMRRALVADGLYPAEADALLETWRASYFESAGLRLLYLLPRAWIDQVLPLEASVDADVVRTMVGRVEIVTPSQREKLRQIAAGPASAATWLLGSWPSEAESEAPVDFRAYRDLGRFRNALVLDERQRRPTTALDAFVKNYQLQGYQPGALVPMPVTSTSSEKSARTPRGTSG
jgi:hypothetical protein